MDTLSALIFVSLALIVNWEIWCSALPANQGSNPHTTERQTKRRKYEDDDDIDLPTYTGYTPTKVNLSAAGKGSNCVEGICQDARDYPKEYMRRIVKEANLQNVNNDPQGVLVYKENRFNVPDDPNYDSLCTSEKQNLTPKTMKNEKDEEKFIVNIEEFVQSVLIETCSFPGNKTSCRTIDFPGNIEARCVQKYATVRLYSTDNVESEKPSQDNFVIPGCCICQYYKKSGKK